jgi:hypothetical protein
MPSFWELSARDRQPILKFRHFQPGNRLESLKTRNLGLEQARKTTEDCAMHVRNGLTALNSIEAPSGYSLRILNFSSIRPCSLSCPYRKVISPLDK